MPMTRSKRLEPIAQLQHARERDAAQALGQSRRRLADEQARLEELYGYREQYARRYREALQQGLGVKAMQDYQQFLTRLGEAIEQQGRRIDQVRRELEASRARWLAVHVKAEALDAVLARCRTEELRREARREQREHDERARRGSVPTLD